MHHHGKGVYSGTFSGTLNPALQDKHGRPKRDISTIIHILNDLLCATPQYRQQSASSQSRPATPPEACSPDVSLSGRCIQLIIHGPCYNSVLLIQMSLGVLTRRTKPLVARWSNYVWSCPKDRPDVVLGVNKGNRIPGQLSLRLQSKPKPMTEGEKKRVVRVTSLIPNQWLPDTA